MRKFLLLGLIGTLISGSVLARTWKSADGSKTIEGTLRSYDKNRGTVNVVTPDGKLLTFKQDMLSGEDREFLLSQESAKSGPAQPADFTAELEKTKVGKLVAGAKLKLVEKKRLASAKLAKAPEFYILYYSASWCGPCRAAAPDTVKKYKSIVEENPKVEMIHVSADRNDGAAEEWAVEEKFPWFTVLPDDVEKSGLRQFKTTGFVPEYTLVNANGEQLGSGSGVFDQVKGLTK